MVHANIQEKIRRKKSTLNHINKIFHKLQKYVSFQISDLDTKQESGMFNKECRQNQISNEKHHSIVTLFMKSIHDWQKMLQVY